MCAMPRANPPASAKPTFGASRSLSPRRSQRNSRNLSLATAQPVQSIAYFAVQHQCIYFKPLSGEAVAGLTALCWFCNLYLRVAKYNPEPV